MPWRSRLIASVRSSRSVTRLVCCASTSRSSSSARRLTAPSRSRSRRSLSSRSSTAATSGSVSPGAISASAATLRGLGLEHLADLVRDVGGAPVRGLEPLLGARLARCALRPSPRARRAPPCRPRRARSRRRRGGRRLRAARLRPARPRAISARRCSANAAGAPSSEVALGLRVADAAAPAPRSGLPAPPCASVPFGALRPRSRRGACARNSASRASACASPRASASTARLAATSPRDSAS